MGFLRWLLSGWGFESPEGDEAPVHKEVGLSYPLTHQPAFENRYSHVSWISATHVPRRCEHGWEVVLDDDGCVLVHDELTLIGKPKAKDGPPPTH